MSSVDTQDASNSITQQQQQFDMQQQEQREQNREANSFLETLNQAIQGAVK